MSTTLVGQGPNKEAKLETLVRLEKVSKSYPMGQVEVKALHEVDLELGRGEFVVLLGPSGCGKTTLLNLIGGMDSPTSGSVLVDGVDIASFDEERLTAYRRDQIGFVFQFFNLIPTLTARENVQLAAELVSNPRDPLEVLEEVGLGERGDHFPGELSGGEQQRVAIARAIVKNPSIMLCDEPTGELDSETGRKILVVLQHVSRVEGKTVLVVTHNAAIGGIADQVIRMRSGAVVSQQHQENPLSPETVDW